MTVTATADPTAEVFLSPRVVDAAAFHEFAAALRTLVGRAADQHRTLDSTLTRSEAVLKQLSMTPGGGDSKAIAPRGSALETRLAELEARVTRALDRPAASPAETDRFDSAEMEAMIERSVLRVLATLGGTPGEARIEAAIRQRLSEAESTLARVVERSIGRLGSVAADAEAYASEACRNARATLDTTKSQFDAFGARLAGSVEACQSRLEPLHAQVERQTADLEGRLRRVSDEITRTAFPGLKSLTVLCERASAVLGCEPGSGASPTPGSLSDLVPRSEALRETADFAARQLEAVREQAEHARRLLSETLTGTAAALDELTTRQETLRDDLAKALETADRARQSLEKLGTKLLQEADKSGGVAEKTLEAPTPRQARAATTEPTEPRPTNRRKTRPR